MYSLHGLLSHAVAGALAATPSIAALVAKRRAELVQQIAVGTMDLNNVETNFASHLGCLSESSNYLLNFWLT